MTNRTAETEADVTKAQIIKEINVARAFLMLASNSFFDTEEVAMLAPKLEKNLADLETLLNKL